MTEKMLKQLEAIRKVAEPCLEGYVMADRETDQQARERIIAEALRVDDTPSVYKEIMKMEVERLRERAMKPSMWVELFPPTEEEIIDDPERQEC